MTQVDNAPIILIHGWGMNKQIWNGIIEAAPLSLRSRLIPLDMPGYGENEAVLQPYNFENLVDWFSNWLETNVSDNVSIVGWSLGGLVAQQLALLHPNKVCSLGLVATSPRFIEGADWPGIKPEVLNMFAQQLTVSHDKTVDRFLKIQAMGSESARQDMKQIKEWIFSVNSPRPDALKSGLDMLRDVDLRDQIKDLSVPVKGIFGKLDSLVPIKMLDQLKELLPDSEINVIEKVSHAPFISEKQAFIEWLKKV